MELRGDTIKPDATLSSAVGNSCVCFHQASKLGHHCTVVACIVAGDPSDLRYDLAMIRKRGSNQTYLVVYPHSLKDIKECRSESHTGVGVIE